MVLLNKEQIQYLLNELDFDTVVEPSQVFNYRVQYRGGGYKKGIPGTVQAALSIGLEMENKRLERLEQKEGPA